MKKIYFYAAALAVSAALSSCSESEVAEQIVEPVVPQGEAFGVTATLDGDQTRATGFADVDVTDISTLTFRMSGLESGEWSSTGKYMSKDDAVMNTTEWVNTNGTWGDGNTYTWTGDNYDFYAVGNNKGTRSSFITPFVKISSNTPGNTATSSETIQTADDDQGITFPSFTYNLPTDVANQEDLVVAGKLGQNSGKVGLNFKHALAKIKVQAIYRESFLIKSAGSGSQSYEDRQVYAWIKSVKFHGLATKGVFKFLPDSLNKGKTAKSYGEWSVSNVSNRDEVITMDFGASTPKIVRSQNPTAAYNVSNYVAAREACSDDNTTATELGYMYAIPDSINKMTQAWDYVNGQPIMASEDGEPGTNSPIGKAYVELECCMALVNKDVTITDETSDAFKLIPYNEFLDDEEAWNEDHDEGLAGVEQPPTWWTSAFDAGNVSVEWMFAGKDKNTDDTTPRLGQWGNNTVSGTDEWGDDFEYTGVGYATAYLPLNLVSLGLDFNGNYVLTLNLQRASKLYQITGSSANAGKWTFISGYSAAKPSL